jgi:catechol 2,3-dioxygenase-like lactoylglutathione lyase family enzyme
MSTNSKPASEAAALESLRGLVPMAHVADVARSIEFYCEIGFEVLNTLVVEGRLQWAWVKSGTANLMLARSARPMNPDGQDVLFYLYAPDVAAYRDALAAKGIRVSELSYPEYGPDGEFRMSDPDGYCLLVGQGD